ncbi:DUF3866 family protein [Brachybacterium halotolerans subsp. kimchii]|uniref:DUF3866 family protein n=1 Tax=Brachybacterium halotolerans TaxID=2795215 RepID=UPI001E55CDED|nr:DUF3866 family protein [Brachybacterium halotolerans]UEJ83174.1 DUF3866 family protein [Brachybacterium halotolerans subsp. kimchii]
MLQWERGRVLEVSAPWRGVQVLRVARSQSPTSAGADGAAPAAEDAVPALSYPELVGEIVPGEVVLLNANALRRGLGTGGQALVVARTGELPQTEQPTGHMVKARYTPMQTLVDALDDPGSPHRAALEGADDLGGMPVVLADLHSALPAVVAGVRAEAPQARIAYVMSDGAALPAAYSRTIARLRETGELVTCISAGQAFGGDLEAVTVHTALLGAKAVCGADVVVLAQGPGNLGTGTAWGFSGIQAAEGLHATAVLGGRPIAALRVSGADARARHYGVSHHSLTLLGRAALAAADVPVLEPAGLSSRGGHGDGPGDGIVDGVHDHDPDHADSTFTRYVTEQVKTAVVEPAAARGVEHRIVDVASAGLREALEACPVGLRTMGRGLEEDPWPFLYAAAAGRRAAQLAQS